MTAREGIPMLTDRHPADQTAAPKEQRRCLPSSWPVCPAASVPPPLPCGWTIYARHQATVRWRGGVIAMRRIGVIVALGALLSMSGAVVTASPAVARGDGWQVVPAPPAITLPAAFCGFGLQITFPVNREFVKVLKTSDGSMILLATGFASASFTNLETGKTLTQNTSGPAKFVVSPDGSVTELEKGLNGLVLTPADAARFGLPTVSVTAGARTVSVAPDGNITSLSLQGHVLVDVCAALS